MGRLLTTQQIKDEYGYARSTLLRWEKQGKIKPQLTPGGHRRYDAEQFAAKATPGAPTANADNSVSAALATPQRVSPSQLHEYGVVGYNKWQPTLYPEPISELRGHQGLKLLHEMRINDPVIAATFMAIENALRAASWRVSPVSETQADREVAEFVESCLHDQEFTWDDTLSFILEMLETGASVLEVVYKRRLGPRPPAYTGTPAKSNYNDGRIGWRKWAPRPMYSLQDGSEFELDDHGAILGVNQYDPLGNLIFIPLEKLLLFRTTVSPANTPYGQAIHRAMYLPYWYSMNLMEIEGIGVERDLNGIPVVYLGRDCTLEGTDSDYEMAKKLVQNIRMDEQAGIVVPKPKMGSGNPGEGILVELLSSPSRRNQDTNLMIERYNRLKASTVLAQFIMLGIGQQGAGGVALAKFQGDLFNLAVGAWLRSIAGVINTYAIPRLLQYNYFPNATGMPRIVPSSAGVPNLQDIAEFINKLVGAEVIHPDSELERHLRQLAMLPVPPVTTEETPQTTGQRTSTLADTAMTLRRLQMLVKPLVERGLLSQQEFERLLAPMTQEMRANIAGKPRLNQPDQANLDPALEEEDANSNF